MPPKRKSKEVHFEENSFENKVLTEISTGQKLKVNSSVEKVKPIRKSTRKNRNRRRSKNQFAEYIECIDDKFFASEDEF